MATTSAIDHIPYPHTLTFEAFKKEKLKEFAHRLENGLPQTTPTRARYRGTVKLHGTNASLIFRNGNAKDATFQSRNRIITATSDHYGTVALLSKVNLEGLVAEILRIRGPPDTFDTIMIAGELAGTGIQKGVAIAALPRFFCIFNISIDGIWVDLARYASVEIPEKRVFNIVNYKTFEVEIDLAGDTTDAFQQMTTYTSEVALQCPFAAAFDVSGAGEGIVWTIIPEEDMIYTNLVNFKTKADAFAVTATAPRDLRTLRNTAETDRAAAFVDYALTERRLEQGVEYVREMGKEVAVKNLGVFVNWLTQDIIREEGDTMKDMSVDERCVKNAVTKRAKGYWFAKCTK